MFWNMIYIVLYLFIYMQVQHGKWETHCLDEPNEIYGITDSDILLEMYGFENCTTYYIYSLYTCNNENYMKYWIC